MLGPTEVVRWTAERPTTRGRTNMASAGKKKTTFAKLARERKLRERRIDKEARKAARKRAAEFEPAPLSDAQPFPSGEAAGPSEQ